MVSKSKPVKLIRYHRNTLKPISIKPEEFANLLEYLGIEGVIDETDDDKEKENINKQHKKLKDFLKKISIDYLDAKYHVDSKPNAANKIAAIKLVQLSAEKLRQNLYDLDADSCHDVKQEGFGRSQYFLIKNLSKVVDKSSEHYLTLKLISNLLYDDFNLLEKLIPILEQACQSAIEKLSAQNAKVKKGNWSLKYLIEELGIFYDINNIWELSEDTKASIADINKNKHLFVETVLKAFKIKVPKTLKRNIKLLSLEQIHEIKLTNT